jgi:hypothetical protein
VRPAESRLTELASWFSDCESDGELLVRKLPSPLYVAVIVCPAVVNAEVLMLAVLPLRETGLPICVLPSKNVTVPVGVPAPRPAAVTVAVKSTV